MVVRRGLTLAYRGSGSVRIPNSFCALYGFGRSCQLKLLVYILYVLQKRCYGCGKNVTDTQANRYNMLSSGCAKACIREIC